MKDPQTEIPKVRGTESLSGPPRYESSGKAQKKKKKKQRQRERERRESSTPVIGVNTAQTREPHQKKKKKHCLDKAPCDTS